MTAPESSGPTDSDGSSLGGASGSKRAVTPHLWVPSTYFAEGFPYSIVNSLAEVFFQQMGASLSAIGLTSLFHLPWNLKFLWAPFVDRVATKRHWMALLQGVSAVVLLALSLLSSGVEFLGVAAALFLFLGVLSATNDVAIDGYYMEALDESGQSRFVGYRAMAYKVSSLLVRGPLLGLAGLVGFQVGWLVMAGVLAVLAVGHFLLLPPDARKRSGAGELKVGAHYRAALLAFLKTKQVILVLAFVLLFRTGESFLQKMKWPFLNDVMGITVGEYALANGTVGVASSFIATFIGGALIAKHGLRRWLWPFLLAQNVLNLLYVALAVFDPLREGGVLVATAVIFAEEFGAGLGTAVFMVYLMRLCHPEHKAAHFALLTALMSVGFTLAGSVSGYLAEATGYSVYFAITFVSTLPMMLLATRVPKLD